MQLRSQNKPKLKVNYIEEALAEYFGERCPDTQVGCFTCEAWMQWDRILLALEILDADISTLP